MKHNLLIYCMLIIGFVSFGQSQKTLQATYSFYNLNVNEVSEIKLLINKNTAFSEFINNQKIENQTTDSEDNNNVNIELKNNDPVGKQYYVTKNEIVFRDHIYSEDNFHPVVVSENMPQFHWNLLNETKKIGNFQCKKASLNFRGRNFIAWYTTDIATPFGPWKFYGLPGLIVEIKTDDESIAFQLSKIEYLLDMELTKPSNGTKITFDDYVKKINTAGDDFVKQLQAKMPRGTMVISTEKEINDIEKQFD